MAPHMITLGEILPESWRGRVLPAFAPAARYYAPMDSVVYLTEDVSYRADRIDDFLTLLWHPTEQRAVGLKIKGFRFIFERLRAIADARGKAIPNDVFISLLEAVEVAISVELGAAFTAEAEKDRMKQARERDAKYQKARELARSVQIDLNELEQAA